MPHATKLTDTELFTSKVYNDYIREQGRVDWLFDM